MLFPSVIYAVTGKQLPTLLNVQRYKDQLPLEPAKQLGNVSEKAVEVNQKPTDAGEADRVRRAAEQASEQATYEEEAAKQAAERNAHAQKGIVVKIEKVRAEVKEAAQELTRWRTQMRATIEEALIQQKSAVKAARDRADAEQHFAQSVEAVQKISEFAKTATLKAMKKMEAADQVIEQATNRKKLAKKISDKAETEARYYKELGDALSKQRKAVEDAASEIETAKRARAAKEAAEKKANTVLQSYSEILDDRGKGLDDDSFHALFDNSSDTSDTRSTDALVQGLESLDDPTLDDPTEDLFTLQLGSNITNIQVPANKISAWWKAT